MIITLWLQSAGLAALIHWVRHALASDAHRLGPFRFAVLVVRLTAAVIVLHGVLILFWASSYRRLCSSSSESDLYFSASSYATVGYGDEANSVASWNGSQRPTTVVSTTVLTVNLTAADLQSPGTGALTVSNPGPSAATSPASPLTVSSQPVIQSVSISTVSTLTPSNCSQFQVTVTGTGFDGTAQIQANGTLLLSTVQNSATTAIGFVPSGFQSAVGGLSFTVSNIDQPNIVSSPYAYPATNPPNTDVGQGGSLKRDTALVVRSTM